MVDSSSDMEDVISQMREKFLETAEEKLDRLNEILLELATNQGDYVALIEEFKRDIHSLKGMGGTFQMPFVTKLCHKFEEFLDADQEFDLHYIDACHRYVDRLADFIEKMDDVSSYDESEWLSGLPEATAVEEPKEDSAALVLVVNPDESQNALVEAAFAELDFKFMSASDPFHGIKQAYAQKPSIVIVSQSMGDIDGAEILRCLGAMRLLSSAKFAMICPDRRKALDENLKGVQLLSEKNLEIDIMNFVAIAVTA